MKSFIYFSIGSCMLLLGCGAEHDSHSLRGNWKMCKMAGDFSFGLPTYKLDNDFVLSFDDDGFRFITSKASGQIVKGTFKCDKGAVPRKITFDFVDRTVIAIYELKNGKLRICVGKQDHIAPDVFSGGPESRPALMEFIRDMNGE